MCSNSVARWSIRNSMDEPLWVRVSAVGMFLLASWHFYCYQLTDSTLFVAQIKLTNYRVRKLMKKIISSMLFTAVVAFCTPASAYVIKAGEMYAGTNVGALDTLLGQSSMQGNSNPTSETKWVNSILDIDTSYVDKTNNVNIFATVESSSVFAFQLNATPGYFLIKNAKWWAVFENNGNASWGVVDFSKLNSGFKFKDLENTKISHVSEFGKFANVPEPSGLLLLGLGLLGLSVKRRCSKG